MGRSRPPPPHTLGGAAAGGVGALGTAAPHTPRGEAVGEGMWGRSGPPPPHTPEPEERALTGATAPSRGRGRSRWRPTLPSPPARQLLGAGAGVRARSPRPALPARRLASARRSGSAPAAPQPVGEGSGPPIPLNPPGSPAPAAPLTWRRPSPPAALPAAAGRRRRVGTGEAAEPQLAPAPPPPPAVRPLFIKLFCLVVRPVTRPRARALRLAGAWR